MIFDSPVGLSEAIKILSQKKLMPTSLTSAEIRAMDSAIRNQAFFSAQTTLTDLLGKYKETIESIVNPKQVLRPGETQTVTEGYNPATANERISNFLKSVGYEPEEGTRGTLTDLSSDKRIDLVIDTNTKLAHGAGSFVQQNDSDVVDLWPALAFVRFENRKEPRNWEQRWRIAAATAGDVAAARILEETGRMVALKSSGIWQALGDGAGGYDDTLGNPYAPFAFGSGMWTEEIDRKEAEELGLIGKGDPAEPAEFDFARLFATPELS